MSPIQRKSQFNSFIIGTVLGDASLKGNPRTKKANLTFLHSEKQAPYLDWKVQMMRGYAKPNRHENINNNGYPARLAYYNSQRLFFWVWDMFYSTGRKRVTWKILKKLDPLGIAVWYMDDGSLILRKNKANGSIKTREIHFSTQSFTVGENKMIQQYFKSQWGVEFRLTTGKGLPRLWCNTANTHKFLEIVGDIVSQVPSMSYKADMKYVRGPYIIEM